MAAIDHSPTHLCDYSPPPFLISQTDLEFELDKARAKVKSLLTFQRNPSAPHSTDLVLVGRNLDTQRVRFDAETGTCGSIEIAEETLTVRGVPDRFKLETEVFIYPDRNRSLEGLYYSSPNLCTQCEPEGFRKITWYLDRPDVLARFRTRIIGDPGRFPVMLSNGNCAGRGSLPDGRHWTVWDDPFPKPSYLFALVAGQLECLEDSFTTMSGRNVSLRIYAKGNDIANCDHAMRSLKLAMRWDENAYGLECDLDDFMIVVIDDFNMGAMENKGLNIFNARLVLARPDTATDHDFAAIESVIAHEYFHNWTGNRVTCRNWFQLGLKEGLTVFREQQFSEDTGSRHVQRINQARILRTFQFPEDAGPMAHPVRPDSYIEISNFYTVTVYEKGAEVIRMLYALLGDAAFHEGMRLYLERHDGQAATVEDFVCAMQTASGRDLRQFMRWYSQAGTPRVTVRESHDPATAEYILAISQHTPRTPQQADKLPLQIPLRLALLGENGDNLPLHCPALHLDGATETVVELREDRQEFRFGNIAAPPALSIARGFSAPIRVEASRSDADLWFQSANDTDPFNRWDSLQEYATRLMLDRVACHTPNATIRLAEPFVQSMRTVLQDPALEPAFLAEVLALPSESILADRVDTIDIDAIHVVHRDFTTKLAWALKDDLFRIRDAHLMSGPYRFDHENAGRRSLANECLRYLMRLRDPVVVAECDEQLRTADNMTLSLAALGCLANHPGPEREEGLAWFHDRWKAEPLVLDKWFMLQATSSLPDTLQRVTELVDHPAFNIENPNRVRSLIGAFCHRNQRWFHDASGAGYRFLSTHVLGIDAFNPQLAAQLLGAASRMRRLDEQHRELLYRELENVLGSAGLSKECYEIASKTLA